MDLVAQLVGLPVELSRLLTVNSSIVLQGLGLILLDLIEFTLKVRGLFSRELSLGYPLINPSVQIVFSSVNAMMPAFMAMSTGSRSGVRALGHAGECGDCGDQWEEV